MYFKQSQEYYDIFMENKGRYAYTKFDNDLFSHVNTLEKISFNAESMVECIDSISFNALFIGEGGMGKTTSLLKLWHKRLNDIYIKNQIPIYIPLNEYNKDVDKSFISKYIYLYYGIDIYSIKCNILLLLDGFNEISQNNNMIIREIDILLVTKKNIQIVVTARYNIVDTYGLNNIKCFELQPLNERNIYSFLKRKKISINKNMLSVIRIPMMLSLYGRICAIKESIEINKNYLLDFKTNQNVAEILYNYMLCQIGKLILDNDFERIPDVGIALFCIAPYIAYKIELQNSFHVDKDELLLYINEYMELYGSIVLDFFTKKFQKIIIKYRIYQKIKFKNIFVYLDILINEQQMLMEEKNTYKFCHQYYRDFLSSMHIINSLIFESIKLGKSISDKEYNIPNEFKKRYFDNNICTLIGEYVGEYKNSEGFLYKTYMHDIIESLRGKILQKHDYTLNNVINIWKQTRHGNLSGENLSNLDFRNVMLNGLNFHNDNLQTCFDDSKFTNKSFVPEGHLEWVIHVIFEPGGNRIISSSGDNTIKIWDSARGLVLKTLYGHSDSVRCTIFSPDNKYLVSASGDGTIKIWEITTWENTHTICAHKDSVRSIVFSKDGNYLISASVDKTIKIWDAKNYQLIKILRGHDKKVIALASSPTENCIYSTSYDCTIKKWNLDNGEPIFTIYGHNVFRSISCSPDGQQVISGSDDGSIKIWDGTTGVLLYTLCNNQCGVNCVIYSPNGKKIIAALKDGTIQVWDNMSYILQYSIISHTDWITSIAYKFDNKHIVSSSGDGTIKIWDIESGIAVKKFRGYTGNITSVAFDKNNSFIAVAFGDGTVRIWDITLKCWSNSIKCHFDKVTHIAYNSTGNFFATSSVDKLIKIWNSQDGTLIAVLSGHTDWVTSIAFSSNGSVLVSASGDKTIKVWNSIDGRLMNSFIAHRGWITDVAISPNGKNIISVSGDRTMKLWDCRTGQELNNKIGHLNSIYCVSYSDNGECFLTASYDNFIKIWDSETFEQLYSIKTDVNSTSNIIFCHDGKNIAYSLNGIIIIRDFKTGQVIKKLFGHSNTITHISYSFDRQFIISASTDDTVRIWNVESGKCVDVVVCPMYGVNVLGCHFTNTCFRDNNLYKIIKNSGGITQ